MNMEAEKILNHPLDYGKDIYSLRGQNGQGIADGGVVQTCRERERRRLPEEK